MDRRLVGFWRIDTIDMVPDRAVQLIGGLLNEIVEFTDNDRYVLWGDPSDPRKINCRFLDTDPPAMDFWIRGLESLGSKCLLDIQDSRLKICIAGDSGERPTEIRRDDELLWCVMSLERWNGPRPVKTKRRKRRPLLKPGRLIPDGFLDDVTDQTE